MEKIAGFLISLLAAALSRALSQVSVCPAKINEKCPLECDARLNDVEDQVAANIVSLREIAEDGRAWTTESFIGV